MNKYKCLEDFEVEYSDGEGSPLGFEEMYKIEKGSVWETEEDISKMEGSDTVHLIKDEGLSWLNMPVDCMGVFEKIGE